MASSFELNKLYQKTIDDQRNHLMELQTQFNARCDEIKKKAEEKMKPLKPDDKEGKTAVLQEQKRELEEALSWLKQEVNHSTRQTMHTLEDIQRQREKFLLEDLEKQLASL